MSGAAVALLVCAVVIVWGGLLLSVLALRARPERTDYPAGGVDDHRGGEAVTERDT